MITTGNHLTRPIRSRSAPVCAVQKPNGVFGGRVVAYSPRLGVRPHAPHAPPRPRGEYRHCTSRHTERTIPLVRLFLCHLRPDTLRRTRAR
eukprot:1175974-Prorocentrum_minimum.AAC.1